MLGLERLKILFGKVALTVILNNNKRFRKGKKFSKLCVQTQGRNLIQGRISSYGGYIGTN